MAKLLTRLKMNEIFIMLRMNYCLPEDIRPVHPRYVVLVSDHEHQ